MDEILSKKNCEVCGKLDLMPFECNYCGNFYCSDHRLPENHNCVGLLDKEKLRESRKSYRPQISLNRSEETQKIHVEENENIYRAKVPLSKQTNYSETKTKSSIQKFLLKLIIPLIIMGIIFVILAITNPVEGPAMPVEEPAMPDEEPAMPDEEPAMPIGISSIEGEISDDKGNIFHFNKSTPNRANLSLEPDSVWGYLDINSETIKIKIKDGTTKKPLSDTKVVVCWDSHFTKNQSLILGHEIKNTDSKGQVVFSKSEAIRRYSGSGLYESGLITYLCESGLITYLYESGLNESGLNESGLNESALFFYLYESGLYGEVTQIYFHIEPQLLLYREFTSEIYIYRRDYNITYHGTYHGTYQSLPKSIYWDQFLLGHSIHSQLIRNTF